ncbi:MAG: TetR/AcrR family transcriptional regulator [Hydrocarboniphaga sp.]|uniref:TetR/AcrR family transcriptional regulator n=1 Tax=Hydrocarboniphaga sp. TaxID=2033016 RepID=UPI0026139113|nr:TetR/AcrR family transcriptional regulator [Hydrocarboniphaga sp.]MDB5968655.1 TetR/AcrR family transcriptional regulator [Hydrocarboniphaga sp.]
MSERSPQKTRTRNPEQTRARLLQATIDLVAEKGAGALSLKEAARVANVSRGVAYQHFEDRDHLLREAQASLSERLAESMAGELHPDTMEDRVYQVARLVLNNREASRILIADALAGKNLTKDHPLYRLLTDALEQFRASGSARQDMDLEILSSILVGVVTSIVMLSYQVNSDVDTVAQRFTDEWTGILREGIFVKHPAA